MRTADGVVTRVFSPPSRIECAYRDPFDSVWLGGVDGLWRLSAIVFSHILYPGLTPTGHNVQAMTLDRSGALWVSFDRNGVYRLKGGSWTRSGGLLNFPTDPALIETTDAEGRHGLAIGTIFSRCWMERTFRCYTPTRRGCRKRHLDLRNWGTLWIGGDKGIESWRIPLPSHPFSGCGSLEGYLGYRERRERRYVVERPFRRSAH